MTQTMLFQHMSETEVHGHLRGRTLASGRTAVQSYEIVELGDSGRSLVLDGCVQFTERDEELYHEALVFPAYAHANRVRSVLCLGGANGGLLRQVLKFPALEQVHLIGNDAQMYEVSQVYFPGMQAEAPNDPRVTMTFGEPAEVVAKMIRTPAHTGKFDVVVADLPDATSGGFAASMFTHEFYDELRTILAPGAIYATHAGQAHFRHCGFLNRVLRTLSTSFAHAIPYTVAVPSLGTPWAFVLASDGVNLRDVTLEKIRRRLELLPATALVSYDVESHVHMFHLPKVLRTAIAQPAAIIAAGELAFVSVADTRIASGEE